MTQKFQFRCLSVLLSSLFNTHALYIHYKTMSGKNISNEHNGHGLLGRIHKEVLSMNKKMTNQEKSGKIYE